LRSSRNNGSTNDASKSHASTGCSIENLLSSKKKNTHPRHTVGRALQKGKNCLSSACGKGSFAEEAIKEWPKNEALSNECSMHGGRIRGGEPTARRRKLLEVMGSSPNRFPGAHQGKGKEKSPPHKRQSKRIKRTSLPKGEIRKLQ